MTSKAQMGCVLPGPLSYILVNTWGHTISHANTQETHLSQLEHQKCQRNDYSYCKQGHTQGVATSIQN